VAAFYFGSIIAQDSQRIHFGTSVATVYLSLIGLSIPITPKERLSLKILVLTTCVGAAIVLWGFQGQML
jgi:hypothetical protein